MLIVYDRSAFTVVQINDLVSDRTYKVFLTGRACGAKDNPLAQDHSWLFTTASTTSLQSSTVASTVAGTVITLTVRAFYAYNDAAAGYRGTVKFESSDPQAILPAPYTFTTCDRGLKTFSIALKTSGAQSITASDYLNPNVQVGVSVVTVEAAVAASLRMEAPMVATLGTPVRVTVTAVDAFGNIAAGYGGTVSFFEVAIAERFCLPTIDL